MSDCVYFGIKKGIGVKSAPIFPFSSGVMDIIMESSFLFTLISRGILGFQSSNFVI